MNTAKFLTSLIISMVMISYPAYAGKKTNSESVYTLLILTTVDRNNISVTDSVLVSTRLYASAYKYHVFSIEPIRRSLPDFCFCKPVELDSLFFEHDSINGVECVSALIDSYWIYPGKAGVIEIPSSCYAIEMMVRDTSIDFVDAFFGKNKAFNYSTAYLNTNPVSIHIDTSPLLKPAEMANDIEERNGVIFALDMSVSMSNIFDFDGSRLEKAKSIISEVASEENMVILFAEKAEAVIPSPRLSHALDTMSLSKEHDGTALYDLCLSVAFDTINNYRDVVVFSDGIDNSSHVSMNTMTEVMQRHGVRVNIVSINSEQDSVLCKTLSDTLVSIKNGILPKSDLKYITKETGGLWIRLTNAKQNRETINKLTTIYRRPYRGKPSQRSIEGFYDRLKYFYLRNSQ